MSMKSIDLKGKWLLVTGVCGTVGVGLLKELVARGPAQIIGIDNSESDLFFLAEEYEGHDNVRFFLGDVRDRDTMAREMNGVDIVIHAAALKHVILCEEAPRDAIQTNVLGVQNLIDAALEANVGAALFMSSDKAVNPTNVMGASKLMGERLMTAANARRTGDGPVFTSVRFGNILNSRGSVIPVFRKQIARGGPVSVTDPHMTRFIMTLENAVRLSVDSLSLSHGGEVFVTKMQALKITDLAEVMIEELAPRFGRDPGDIGVRVIGAKAGEKLYEELFNEEEARRTVELEDYFVVLPAFKSVYKDIEYEYEGALRRGVERAYHSQSQPHLTKEELRAYLIDNRLLEDGG